MNPKIEALFERVKNDEILKALLAKHAPLFKSPTYHDYEAALRSNLAYIERFVPEVLECDHMSLANIDESADPDAPFVPENYMYSNKRILDVGPGMGAFMALAKAAGNRVRGIDTGHMSPQVLAYKEITSHLSLNVAYTGFESLVRSMLYPIVEASWEPHFDIVHFRGSLDAVLKLHFRDDIFGAARHLLDWCAEALKPGGCLVVSHNADEVTGEIVRAFRVPHPTIKIVTNHAALSRLVKA